MKTQHIEARTEWATKVRRTAAAAINHTNKVEVLCSGGDRHDLAEMIHLRNQLDKAVDELATYEQGKDVGITQLLGHRPTKVEMIVLTLLIASRFDRTAQRETKMLIDLVTVAGCRQPELVMEARSLFKTSGSLSRLVWLDCGPCLDHSWVLLKETVLSRLLGLEPDETDARCDEIGETWSGE